MIRICVSDPLFGFNCSLLCGRCPLVTGKEPLEAGEDGAFDLGNPSPLPDRNRAKVFSEPSAQTAVPNKEALPQCERDGASGETTAETPTQQFICHKSGDDDTTGGGHGEGFEDTAEKMGLKLPQQEVKVHEPLEEQELSPGPPEEAPAEPPSLPSDSTVHLEQPLTVKPSGISGANFIATGLSNVRLPMPYKRWEMDFCVERADDDSEGEAEFHDALDSVAGMVQDAAKAKDLKETGNGCVL